MPASTKPTYLYRAWDAAGALLYVGITVDLAARRSAHEKASLWWSDVAQFEAHGPMSRGQAKRREREAIWLEIPKHNRMVSYPAANGG